MTGHLPYTEEDVELALAEKRRHVFRDTRECVCGYEAVDGNDWSDHVMRAILAALSSANRLVPPGSEVREEWGAEHAGCEHWGAWQDRASLMAWLAEHPVWRPLRRTVTTFHANPWSVPDTKEGS